MRICWIGMRRSSPRINVQFPDLSLWWSGLDPPDYDDGLPAECNDTGPLCWGWSQPHQWRLCGQDILRTLGQKPEHCCCPPESYWKTSVPSSGPGGCMATAANVIPEGKPTLELLKKLEKEDLESVPQKLMIPQRQELLMELLREEGGLEQLKDWPPELALKFECLLMEYHNIFSLDKNEISCTDAAEHIMELLDEEPFKEWFWCIAPPLPWCNVIVLVCKKGGILWFCMDFQRLNICTKNDAYPLPQMQETMDTMDLKSGFWQVKMSEKSWQYTAFMVGNMGVFKFLRMVYWLCNTPAMFQQLMQNCLGEFNLTYALIYRDVFLTWSFSHQVWLLISRGTTDTHDCSSTCLFLPNLKYKRPSPCSCSQSSGWHRLQWFS